MLKSKVRNRYLPSIDNTYRNVYEIRASILRASEFGSKKTHILYKCFLSHSLLKENLDTLLRLALLEYDEEERIYKTSDLGLDFIYVFEQLRKMLNHEKADEPLILDKDSRDIAILVIHENKTKTIYERCALIIEKRAEIINKDKLWENITLLRKLNLIELENTHLGSNYFEEFLNFVLFNYLG